MGRYRCRAGQRRRGRGRAPARGTRCGVSCAHARACVCACALSGPCAALDRQSAAATLRRRALRGAQKQWYVRRHTRISRYRPARRARRPRASVLFMGGGCAYACRTRAVMAAGRGGPTGANTRTCSVRVCSHCQRRYAMSSEQPRGATRGAGSGAAPGLRLCDEDDGDGDTYLLLLYICACADVRGVRGRHGAKKPCHRRRRAPSPSRAFSRAWERRETMRKWKDRKAGIERGMRVLGISNIDVRGRVR